MHSKRSIPILLSLLTIAALGCGDDSGEDPEDGGPRIDAAGADGAQTDVVQTDTAQTEDAGDRDVGNADTGSDSGVEDAVVADVVLDIRPSSARHTKQPLGSTDAANGYWEYLPPAYGLEPSPLIVFWHGLGENGDGSEGALDAVASNGPPRYVARDEWPNDRPFVVLSPQHAGGGCPRPDEVRDFLSYAIEAYEVDETRIYLSGLSCGAIGSWDYLREHMATTPIAAAVLIAGNGRGAFGRLGCELAALPIWGFHGDSDTTVDVAGTIVPMEGLIACPEPRADQRLTIYEGVGHNSWARTYDLSAGHDIYAWFLEQRRDL